VVRRLAVVLVLAFASLGWPAAMAWAEVAAAAQAAGSLQGDFNADGFVDLAVGVVAEAGDLFSSGLAGSDQRAGSARMAA
jgi:hypothetical protein